MDASAQAADRSVAVAEAALAAAGEATLDGVLTRLAGAARRLTGARYAAAGVPDAEGDAFARFVTDGLSAEEIEAIGPLPRRHGLLGAMLVETRAHRTSDIRADPRFRWWPSAHPEMRSFLGVPIVAGDEVLGALYLTDKGGAEGFGADDEAAIVDLASRAAGSIQRARRHEESRERGVAAERERLARDLHDAMTQRLFSLSLTAEAAARVVRSDPDRAETGLREVGELARETLAEMRALVRGLRPPALADDGLAEALRKHLEVVARAGGIRGEVRSGGGPVGEAFQLPLYRIAQEAIGNAARHSGAGAITVSLEVSQRELRLEIVDDGAGFDPATEAASHRLGLTSMRERAEALGGRLEIRSNAGAGTRVAVVVPRG